MDLLFCVRFQRAIFLARFLGANSLPTAGLERALLTARRVLIFLSDLAIFLALLPTCFR